MSEFRKIYTIAMKQRKMNFSCKRTCTHQNFRFDTFPRGGLSVFADRDQRSTFWGFEIRKPVFLGVLATAAVLFWLLNKCCIFKGFIFSTVLVLG